MKVKPSQWEEFRWFSPDEFAEPDRMDYWLIKLLDNMREHAGKRFTVHFSTDGEHAAGSEHYEGRAVDGHFEGMDVIEMYLLAEQFNPPGLGYYPHWNSPGIHIDTRELSPFEKGARWWRDTTGFYLQITPAAVKDRIYIVDGVR